MTDKQLAEWRRVTEAATPGPWSVVGEGDLPKINDLMIVADGLADADGNEHFVCNVDWTDDVRNPPDARFVAAARTALPALLDEVERLRAREAKMQTLVEAAGDAWAALDVYRDHHTDSEWSAKKNLRAALDALKETP